MATGPRSKARPSALPKATVVAVSCTLPSDDWPFLYLPQRTIFRRAYLWVVGAMAVASVLASLRLRPRMALGAVASTRYHGHLFFLGAAFLLMETHAINRLALLFGTTWLVSAVTIALGLVLDPRRQPDRQLLARVPVAVRLRRARG